jgi:hypothetical protein
MLSEQLLECFFIYPFQQCLCGECERDSKEGIQGGVHLLQPSWVNIVIVDIEEMAAKNSSQGKNVHLLFSNLV